MARIDSLLAIVVQQGANELRVGTDREPRMLAYGAPKRLHMSATNEETLRELLGEILTPEREQTLHERGRIESSYDAESGAHFLLTLTERPAGGFDAVFMKSSARSSAASFSPTSTPSTPAMSAKPAEVRAAAIAAPSFSHAVPIPVAGSPEPSASGAYVAGPFESARTSTAAFGATPDAAFDARYLEPASPFGLPTSVHDSILLSRALGTRASDLHLVGGEPPMVRIDGRIRRLEDDPIDDVLAVLGLDATAAARLHRSGSLELALDLDGGARGRVHVYRTSTGIAANVRFFPRTPPTLASLQLPIPLDDLVDLPHGLVLVCGATGSGKSTTLAALAQEALRRRSIVLVSLEDPIEIALSGTDTSIVRQRQIGRDVPNFASGLRDALREDPDILLVGEMRDAESIALALTAAETGHLVIATLHSGSTASAIERIVDAYPSERQKQIRGQLADSLRVVVAQRLLPRARGGGRLPAVEVLRVNHAAAAMIREGKTAQITSVLQSGRREGMIPLERSLADRVQAGEVLLDDARAAANDAGALANYLAK